MIDLEKLEIEKAMALNAKLQSKKNALRKALSEKGVMEKDKENAHSHYKYFSESGYKKLFTELFSAHGLELSVTEKSVDNIEGTSNMPFGRRVTLVFTLTDTDTGYFEVSEFSGEGMDMGDKGIYKAYTGALKYYLASTFNVATGDDPETESPSGKKEQNPKGRSKEKQESSQNKEDEILGRQINKVQYESLMAEIKRTGSKIDPTKAGFASLEAIDFKQWKKYMTYMEKMADKKREDLGL